MNTTFSQCTDNVTDAPILAIEVPADRRLDYLPRLVGPKHMLRFEGLAFRWANLLSDDYNGGEWAFFDLSNGGGYIAPRIPSPVLVQVQGNGYEGKVSSDAFGVIASLFALNALCSETELDRHIDLYDKLREFVAAHPEASAIWSAID